MVISLVSQFSFLQRSMFGSHFMRSNCKEYSLDDLASSPCPERIVGTDLPSSPIFMPTILTPHSENGIFSLPSSQEVYFTLQSLICST